MRKTIYAGKHIPIVKDVPTHSHECWELVYCNKGSGKFINMANLSETDYLMHDCVLIPPKLLHANTSVEGFSNTHLLMDEIELPRDKIIKIADNASLILQDSFNQIYYYYTSTLPNKHEVISHLSELIASCSITFLDTVFFSPTVEQIRMDIIKNFSDADFNVNMCFNDKAYSDEYLKKLFKKETGFTPLHFLMDTRINQAKKLLKKRHITGANISEISFLCGFADPLYFSRLFKKVTGCAPQFYH